MYQIRWHEKGMPLDQASSWHTSKNYDARAAFVCAIGAAISGDLHDYVSISDLNSGYLIVLRNGNSLYSFPFRGVHVND